MFSLKAFGILSGIVMIYLVILTAIGISIGVYEIEDKTFHEEYDKILENTVLKVDSSNGDVKVHTWDETHPLKDKIEVHARFTTFWGEEILDDAGVEVTEGRNFLVKVVLKDKAKNSVNTKLTIHVPANITVEEIKTSNGNVDVSDLAGDLHIITSNDNTIVKEHTGNLTIDSSNGEIEVRGCVGYVDVYTSNDDITIRDVSDYVIADNFNGGIDVRSTWSVHRAVTSNDDIYLSFKNLSVDETYIDNSNSDVELHLPANMSAHFNLKTSNAEVEIHGFLVDYQQNDGNYKRGDVNGGGKDIKVRTSNGEIDVYGEVS